MGKSTPSVPSSVTAAQTADENALVSLAQNQQANANQLFNLSEPAIQQGLSFYESLASGSPYAISQAIAPAAQQITQSTAGAVQNILQNTPQGGTRNLAIQQADVAQGAQIGNLASQGYLGAQNALLSGGTQVTGLSQSAAGIGVSGLSNAANIAGTMGSQSIEAQQLQLQSKGQTLGAVGGLAGDAAGIVESSGSSAFGSTGLMALMGK